VSSTLRTGCGPCHPPSREAAYCSVRALRQYRVGRGNAERRRRLRRATGFSQEFVGRRAPSWSAS